MDYRGRNAYLLSKQRGGGAKNPHARSSCGSPEMTSLHWMHMANTGHHFGYDNAKVIEKRLFTRERVVNEALHSGPQTVNRCVQLPARYQAISGMG